MNKQNIPNIITIFRFLLIFPVLYSLLTEQYKLAFFVFVLASLSDGVDGYLARHFRWTSRFGAIADPVADKLLMTTTYLSAAYLGLLPWWLVILVIGRDLIILLGAFIYHLFIEKPDFGASVISKWNTGLQLFLIILILFAQAFPIVPAVLMQNIIQAFIYLVFITTIVSLIDYCWYWGTRARRVKRAKA